MGEAKLKYPPGLYRLQGALQQRGAHYAAVDKEPSRKAIGCSYALFYAIVLLSCLGAGAAATVRWWLGNSQVLEPTSQVSPGRISHHSPLSLPPTSYVARSPLLPPPPTLTPSLLPSASQSLSPAELCR